MTETRNNMYNNVDRQQTHSVYKVEIFIKSLTHENQQKDMTVGIKWSLNIQRQEKIHGAHKGIALGNIRTKACQKWYCTLKRECIKTPHTGSSSLILVQKHNNNNQILRGRYDERNVIVMSIVLHCRRKTAAIICSDVTRASNCWISSYAVLFCLWCTIIIISFWLFILDYCLSVMFSGHVSLRLTCLCTNITEGDPLWALWGFPAFEYLGFILSLFLC